MSLFYFSFFGLVENFALVLSSSCSFSLPYFSCLYFYLSVRQGVPAVSRGLIEGSSVCALVVPLLRYFAARVNILVARGN